MFIGVQGRGQLVLPASIRRRHHLDQAGAQVEVVERADGVIELHPQLPMPAAQTWFWEKNWQEGERRVDQHIAAGRVQVSNSLDSFLTDLDAVRRRRGRKKARSS